MCHNSHRHPQTAQIGLLQLHTVQIVNHAIINPLIQIEGLPCYRSRPIERGAEIVGNRAGVIAGGEAGAARGLQRRIVGIPSKEAGRWGIPTRFREAYGKPRAFRVHPVRVAGISPVFPRMGEIHNRPVRFVRIRQRGFQKHRFS